MNLNHLAHTSLVTAHHFSDATPFLPMLVVEFELAGFTERGHQNVPRFISPGGQVMVVRHEVDAQGHQCALFTPWGAPDEVLASLDFTALAAVHKQDSQRRGFPATKRIIRAVIALVAQGFAARAA